MPGKTAKLTVKDSLEKLVEQVIYDYVFDNFGESEAEDPSWCIPSLARHLADVIKAGEYTGKHNVKYVEY